MCQIWPWLTLVTFELLLFLNRATYQKSNPIYLLESLILGLCFPQIWYSLVHSHLRSMGYKITSRIWAGKMSWIVNNSAVHCQVYWNLIGGSTAAAEWLKSTVGEIQDDGRCPYWKRLDHIFNLDGCKFFACAGILSTCKLRVRGTSLLIKAKNDWRDRQPQVPVQHCHIF